MNLTWLVLLMANKCGFIHICEISFICSIDNDNLDKQWKQISHIMVTGCIFFETFDRLPLPLSHFLPSFSSFIPHFLYSPLEKPFLLNTYILKNMHLFRLVSAVTSKSFNYNVS